MADEEAQELAQKSASALDNEEFPADLSIPTSGSTLVPPVSSQTSTTTNSNHEVCSQGIHFNTEPLPIDDPAVSSFEQQQQGKHHHRHLRQPSNLYCRWILVVLAVAALVLGIALPLSIRHRDHKTAAGSSSFRLGDDVAGSTIDSSIDSSSSSRPIPTPATFMPIPPSPTPLSNEQRLRESLQLVLPSDLYHRMADDFSSSEYSTFQLLLQEDPEIAPPSFQRFVLTHWNIAVGGNAFLPNTSECQWTGIHCDKENVVLSVQWNNRNLTGRLPDSMLPSLTTIDFGENALQGSIPTSWYQNATALQYLYLQNNALTGTISTHIAQLESLRRLYLGANQLSGSLPQELGSTGSKARLLEYLLLQDNNLNGSLPLNWNLRNLFILDLGNNHFTGGIPTDWVQGSNQMLSLRVLYLDRNRFAGELPSRFGEIGNGRLELLSIHDNLFSGTMPTFYNFTMKLNILEIYNNDFSSMDREMCKHSVYEEGELVLLAADCGICPCKNLCSDEFCNTKQLV